MNASIRNFFERGMRIFQTLMIFPLALLLLLIPLEIALGAHIFSLWLRNENWKLVGVCFDVLAIALTLLVVVATLRLFIFWIGACLRTIRGLDAKSRETDS